MSLLFTKDEAALKTIIHFLHIDATPDAVYQALVTQQGLAGWWSTSVTIEPAAQERIDFRFGGDFNPVMAVEARVPAHNVAWRCIAGHDPWRDNTISFQLSAKDGGCELMFTQDYAVELSDVAYGIYNFNWGWYMASLQKYCETGAGTPYNPHAG